MNKIVTLTLVLCITVFVQAQQIICDTGLIVKADTSKLFVGSSEPYTLDITGDGKDDIKIFYHSYNSTCYVNRGGVEKYVEQVRQQININVSNGFMIKLDNLQFVDLFKLNDTVTPGKWDTGGWLMARFLSDYLCTQYGVFGKLSYMHHGYVPLRYKINDTEINGWIEILSEDWNFQIYRYAFESFDFPSIVSNTSEHKPIIISGINGFININGLEGNCSVRVFDMMGKTICSSQSNGNSSLKIMVNKPAIYIVLVEMDNQLIRNKVVVR